jgi:hypothetical protein
MTRTTARLTGLAGALVAGALLHRRHARRRGHRGAGGEGRPAGAGVRYGHGFHLGVPLAAPALAEALRVPSHSTRGLPMEEVCVPVPSSSHS